MIIKRLQHLQPSDLDHVAVWSYTGESDALAIVSPTDRTSLSEVTKGTFIARTQFVLANGAEFLGICSPTDDSGLDYMQPTTLTAQGPVFFWFAESPTEEVLLAQWRRLGVIREQIFPVRFSCTVPVDGRYVSDMINELDLA